MKVFDDFWGILKNIEFVNPELFWLLLLIIPYVAWQIWKRKKMQSAMVITTTQPFEQTGKTLRQRLRYLPQILRTLAFAMFIVAIARPQSSYRNTTIETEGIDIILAMDVSGSMRTMDFSPNRLQACKKIAAEFVENRPNDRFGLVLYSAEAYTQCPLTSDHVTFLNLLQNVNFGLIDEDGTAIGDGLGTAINRLRESQAKSKVIILLTDGVNNAGFMDPLSAAQIAADSLINIKVYTISCGTNGKMSSAQTPYGTVPVKTEIDEALLKEIASLTGGTYFAANNNNKLRQIYKQIDQMEKTTISQDVLKYKNDEFLPFLLLAIGLFILELLCRFVFLRSKP